MRILLLSNMYPTAERPDYGVFVKRLADALRERGHEVDEAVLGPGERGPVATPRAYLELLRRTRSLARRRRPQVIYAHYLVPTGLVALVGGVPFVITAHGSDVANVGTIPLVGTLTRRVIARARAVICVSAYLAERLPSQPRRLEVIDCGVDTELFTPAPREPREPGEGPRYLTVGSLIERKNAGRLIQAFGQLGEGSLTVVGSGPLEQELRASAPPGVSFLGRVPPQLIPELYREHDVYCQASLVEAQGQALLEALATARPVVATRVGGPPEYVTEGAGVLVDPLDVDGIAAGMRRAAQLPVPCQAAREVAERHSIAVSAARIERLLREVS
ncbi:MAG TPA: glycosyltransferase [Gaiellales bacterium]|nr:glycosyltransferase [Gaiellales bacterium]